MRKAEMMTDRTITGKTATGRTAVIIGGGMGGLITGAMLSRSGWSVTVLEQNRNVGGGLQTFWRGGAKFCPGMHLVGGSDGGAAVALLRSLGVDVRLEACDMTISAQFQSEPAPETGDSVVRHQSGSEGNPDCGASEYHIPRGVDGFVKFFSARFPDSAEELKAYVARMQEIFDGFPLLRAGGGVGIRPAFEGDLSQSSPEGDCSPSSLEYDLSPSSLKGDALMPADEFVAKYISNPRLRALLGWLNPLSGVIPGVTPAYVHSIINILYISGSGRFADGAKTIVEQLVGIIENAGGAVRTGCAAVEVTVGRGGVDQITVGRDGVDQITVGRDARGDVAAGQDGVAPSRKMVTGVRGSDGNTYEADIYVGAIHPSALASLCPEDAFPKVFRRRVAAQKPGISMFSLYIKLKQQDPVDSAFPGSSCSARFIMDGDSLSAWRPWGEILCFREGDALTLMAPMSCSEVAGWKDSASDRRPEEYVRWVSERTEQLLERVERFDPGFRDRIESCCASSPLTLGHYLGDPDGAAYGFRIDSSAPSYSRFGPRTHICNLYLTGQNVSLHGLCGVSMAAMMTVGAIRGNPDDAGPMRGNPDDAGPMRGNPETIG